MVLGEDMGEQCPRCGRQFGWRGPRHEVRTTGRWKARASVRYSCRVCGVELEHRQSDTERIAWVASAICLLALFGGLILRDYFGTRVSDAVLLVTSVLASISFVVGALVWMSTQHSSSRPTRPPVDQSAALTC